MGKHTEVIWLGIIIQNWPNIFGIIFQNQCRTELADAGQIFQKSY